MHGTRGTTGSEDCLLLYSGVGKSLIFPIRPFALLAKFEAGKPGGECGSALRAGRFRETQSCCQRRIEWSNPVGLSGAILLSTQD